MTKMEANYLSYGVGFFMGLLLQAIALLRFPEHPWLVGVGIFVGGFLIGWLGLIFFVKLSNIKPEQRRIEDYE